MLEKIKNPKIVAIITFVSCIISYLSILVGYLISKGSEYVVNYLPMFMYKYLLDILLTTPFLLIVYFAFVLFKMKKIKILNILLIIQFILSFLVGIYFYFYEYLISMGGVLMTIQSDIYYLLLLLSFIINIIFIVANKKYNYKLFTIIQTCLFLIYILFGRTMSFHFRVDNEAYLLSYPHKIILYLEFIPFIYYLYLYGKSKNRKD